jgi:LPS-assembly protein
MAEAATSGKQMDWKPRDELSDEQQKLLIGGCRGLYIEPLNTGPEANIPPDIAPLRFSADDVDFSDSNHATLQGNVEIHQGSRRLRSDQVRINQSTSTIILEGNVQLREPGLLAIGERAELNNNAGTSTIDSAKYLLHDSRARGGSQQIRRQADQKVILKEGSFTSCEPNNNDWELRASEIRLDPESGFGSAKHARFNIKDIPVFYFPYVEFPIGDQRKTGLLWPSYSSTSNGGVDLAVPVYINLAPNYDMTFTPRYINTHGWLSELETRYLHEYGLWKVGGAYLGNDESVGDIKTADNPNLDGERWLALLSEKGQFNSNWSSWINYTAVSDNDYFRDLGTTGLDVNRAVQIKRDAGISYNSPAWSLTGQLINYQSLTEELAANQPYKNVPRIDLLKRSGFSNFQIDPLLSAQYIYFEHNEKDRGQRLYAEPGLSYPMHWTPGFVIPTVKIKNTHFAMNSSNDEQSDSLSGDYNITVPTFALDTGVFFERSLNIGQSRFLQTLEPRLFYYYADYTDQTGLPKFNDTRELTFNYNQLFRDTRFSGYDRIGDANQLSAALSTQLYEDDSGRQAFSAGLGQTFYFRDRLVTLSDQPLDPNDQDTYKDHFRKSSDIAAILQWQPGKKWLITSDLIWDPYSSKTEQTGINLQFISKRFDLFNLGYRYTRKDPLLVEGEELNVDTAQADLSTVIALNNQWTFIARWNYDLTDKRTIEDLSGLEYNNCCWKARIVYQRERESFENDQPKSETDPVEYDYTLLFQIEFKGLGGVADNIAKLLEESIPGFKQREKIYH